MCACECSAASVLSDSLWPCGLYSVRLLSPWNSPGKNTRVGCLSLLQGIFPTQGSNPCLLHCRRIFYPLRHLGWAILKRLNIVWLQLHDVLKKANNTDISGCREGEREMNRQSSEDFGIAKILQWYHDSGYMSLCICSDSHQECCCTLDYSPV